MFCSYKNCFISKTSFEWIKIIPKPLSQGVTMFQVIIRLVEQFKFSLMRYYCSKMITIRRHQNARKWPISIKNDHHRIQRRIKFAKKRPNFTSIRKKWPIFIKNYLFWTYFNFYFSVEILKPWRHYQNVEQLKRIRLNKHLNDLTFQTHRLEQQKGWKKQKRFTKWRHRR